MSIPERKQAWAAIKRLNDEANAADEAGDLARATRRCVSGLALLGDAWCDGGCNWEIVERTVGFLHTLVEMYSRQGQLAAAEDCHARGVRVLALPPQPFWARALTTPGFAAWRDDKPMPPGDARCLIPLDVARDVNPALLHHLHTNMGLAYSRADGQMRRSIAAYEDARKALFARVPAGPDRDITEAAVFHNVGNQQVKMGDLQAVLASYDTATRLLNRDKGGGPGVALRRSTLAAHLAVNRANIETIAKRGVDNLAEATDDADLVSFEQAWAHCEEHREGGLASQWSDAEGTPFSVCRSALGRCSTAAQTRTWLLRALTVPGVQTAAKAAAARACRLCFSPPAGGEKLRRCSGCGRVSYCGAECQRTDWPRHKPCCAKDTPEAAIADAACVTCGTPLLDDECCHGVQAPGDMKVVLLRCAHLSHLMCAEAANACPACDAG